MVSLFLHYFVISHILAIPIIKLEGDVGFACPVGVDGDAGDGGGCGGARAGEEGVGEPFYCENIIFFYCENIERCEIRENGSY